mmetsp:Transcript_81028/g.261844  ORF Transcript_81028/g.261844 Transcript_81028/m.261844 type:complete len:207 (-) Transcript_81028:3-623(-)
MVALASLGSPAISLTCKSDCGTSDSRDLRTEIARSMASMDSDKSVCVAEKSACSLSRTAVACSSSLSACATDASSSAISVASCSASASALAMSAVNCSICDFASSMLLVVALRVLSHHCANSANSTSSSCLVCLPFTCMSLSNCKTFCKGVTRAADCTVPALADETQSNKSTGTALIAATTAMLASCKQNKASLEPELCFCCSACR